VTPPRASDERWMRAALDEARSAAASGDVPVGAIVVQGEVILSRAANRTVRDQDPTAHAELLAVRAASAALGSWRLEGCTLYVTLEPCAMCVGAMVHARISRVVFGTKDPKTGACGSIVDLPAIAHWNHHGVFSGGVLSHECGELLRGFFAAKRR